MSCDLSCLREFVAGLFLLGGAVFFLGSCVGDVVCRYAIRDAASCRGRVLRPKF